MTQRERFLSLMRFGSVDRIPLMEVGVWDETFECWHHQGLPRWVTCLQHLEDYLGLDRSWNMNWLPIEDGVRPGFEPQVLEDNGEEQVVIDGRGVTYRQRKHYRTIPQYIRFPVRDMADYERLRPRLDGAHPCEIAAGSDPFLLRRACPRTPLSGGMDKRLLSRGRAGVDAELARVMPLVKEGAFIPMLDHFVPPDMPWETYRYYVEKRRELLARPGA